MGVLSIEEEYWTIQYLTNVTGHREPIFWPLDGQGHYGSETAATDAATTMLKSYPQTRVVHVVRRMRYGPPLTDSTTSDSL